jgi:hypothetical protein
MPQSYLLLYHKAALWYLSDSQIQQKIQQKFIKNFGLYKSVSPSKYSIAITIETPLDTEAVWVQYFRKWSICFMYFIILYFS